MHVSPNGGKPELLVSVKGDELANGPQMLPGAGAVLFTLAKGIGIDRWDKAQIVVQLVKSGERKTLVEGGSDGRYLPTGHLVYALGGTLFALPFDERRLQVTGGPAPILEGVRRGILPAFTPGSAQFSVSNTGSLIYVPEPASTSSSSQLLAMLDGNGRFTPLKLPGGRYESPRISPDGKQVTFVTDDGKEAIVWIYDLSGTSAMRRITFGGRNRFPIWSADGQRIAFQSDPEGDLGIFWQRADGAGTAERLTKAGQGTSHVPESWSPKGDRFSFSEVKGSRASLWTFSLQDRKAAPFGDLTSSFAFNSVFSPDGRWMAYTLRPETGNSVYVQLFPPTGAKYQIGEGGHHPLWSPDGKELFFFNLASPLLAVSVTAQPSFTFGNPTPVPGGFGANTAPTTPRNHDIAPDGKRFIFVDSSQTQSGAASAPEIRVVLNWQFGLSARETR